MYKKLERMVSGIGQAPVEALITWFPGNTKQELIEAIKQSEILDISDNIVYLKSSVTPEEQRVLKKEISFTHVIENNNDVEVKTIKNRLIDVTESDSKEISCSDFTEIKNKDIDIEHISYCKIMKLIFQYNKGVQEKYIELTSDSFENFNRAVISYYRERYDLVKKDGSFSDVKIYSLRHKKNGVEVANLLITKLLNDEIVGFLENNFSEETVYICAHQIFGEAPRFNSREFYVKDAESILEKYRNSFMLINESCALMKIGSKDENNTKLNAR
ncbi:MAG: hypothetical protein ACRC2K_01550 [Clostridium sp.]